MNWYQSVMKTSPRTTPVSRGNYNLVPRADGVTMSVRAVVGVASDYIDVNVDC